MDRFEIERQRYINQPLSASPPGTSGVRTEIERNGKKILLESEAQIWYDAVDSGLELANVDDWIANTAAQFDGTFAFPPHVNTTQFVKIQNQGPIGQCLGISLASVATWLYWITTAEVKIFAGFFNYLKIQQPDGLLGKDKGSVPSTGYRMAQQFGFVPCDFLATLIPKRALQAWGGVQPPDYRSGYQVFKPLLNDPRIAEEAAK